MYTQVTNPAAVGKYNAVYDLGNNVLAKVVINFTYQDRTVSRGQRTAYQVDANGNIVCDTIGHPICSQTNNFEIHVANIQAQQATAYPGWVIGSPPNVNGKPVIYGADSIPQGWLSGAGDPITNNTTGTIGDWYLDTTTNKAWIYDQGLLEEQRQVACNELAGILNHGTLF